MVLYAEGPDGFVRSTLPAIEGALAANEPVLVVAGSERIECLREALGEDAGRVGLTDVRRLARNPARVIPAWRQFLAEQSPNGEHALGVCEVISVRAHARRARRVPGARVAARSRLRRRPGLAHFSARMTSTASSMR